jgi:RHS repeat-associated protein
MNATMISNTDYPYGTYAYGTLKALDFNGDGKDDIALETTTGSGPYTVGTYELISGSSSFTASLITSGIASNWGATTFIDFNSDSCTDYAYGGTIYISGCNGSVPQQISLGTNIIGALDWDGDGRTDILVQNGSTIGVYLSEGDGISGLQSTSIPYNSSNLYFAFDSNGDGLDDLGVYAAAGTVTYYVHGGSGQKPDLLSSVTDGYGNFAKPTYVSVAQGVNSTYFAWNDAAFPYQNYMGPLYIVNQTTYSDPSNQPNGTYQVNDYYGGGSTNLQGRGFSGFANYQTYDGRNGVWTTFGYGRTFPYTGMSNGEVATQNNTAQETIFNRTYTLASTVLDGTQYGERYFPYVSNATDKNYEVGGIENTQLITTIGVSYSYDNYGNATSIQRTTTDNDPGSPYDGASWTQTITNTPDVDTGNWCLTLLSASEITYTATIGGPPISVTKQYNLPDTTDCRYTSITTQASTSYQVVESLGYDDFGNINSDTLTGNAMATRETKANWGATGQFPMSVTDALNETTQFNYSFSYGLVSSETDPNGLLTSWQYADGFGRLTQETRPDSTYTTFVYNDCVSYGGCLMGAHTLALAHSLYNTDGSIETDGTTYYDEVDRPVLSNNMILTATGNAWGQNEVRYDSLGRIAGRAAPCLWSGAVTDACPYWTTMSYDILNRLTQLQRPVNQNDGETQTTNYAYEGAATTITDPYGHARTLIRDPNGWLRQIKDALGYTIILGYDTVGAKTSATDSLGHTLWTGTYAYGVAPFLVSASDVDRGSLTYTLDAIGEPTSWKNANGQTAYQSWDALGRPISRNEPGFNTHWIWGNNAADHNIGKLQNVCTSSGSCSSSYYYSETDTYDNLGRLSQRSIAIPAIGTNTYAWQYSGTTGLPDTLTYPVSTSGKALELKYAYQAGILSSITDMLDPPYVKIWQADAENPAGQTTQETLGNGLVTSRAYDAVTQWLASVQSGPGGGASIQNQSFLYDKVGNVTQRQDNNAGLTENFYYDNVNRLSYSTLNDAQNLSLSYDQMGNITSRSDVAGGATWTYDPVHVHEVTQGGSSAYKYVYDADGNVTSRQGSSITWSSYDYPTLINDTTTDESVSLTYGPNRRALMEQTQSPSGTETAYHVGGLLDIVSSGGVTDYRHYIYAGSEPVAIISRGTDGSNTPYYLLSDHQGSIVAIANASGGVAVGESFTAYGSRRNPTSWSGQPNGTDLTTIAGITRHGYTFQDALGTMGLNDMGGRVQDAIIGRFLSADPYVSDPENTQDWNPYSYTYNNPVTYTDPSGFVTNWTPASPAQCVSVDVEIGEYGSSDSGNVTYDGDGNPIQLPQQQDTVVQSSMQWCEPSEMGIDTGDGSGRNGGKNGNPSPDCSSPYVCQPKTPQPTPVPKPGPPQRQCPKPGFWSNVGNALTNFGSDVHGAGTEASRIGAVTAVVGAGATLVQPEIGAPVLFAGGVFIGVGKLGEGVGTVLSLAGGAILAVEGNSQPFQSAAVDMAQSQFDENIHLPPGVPSPAQPVADAMSGENPCP